MAIFLLIPGQPIVSLGELQQACVDKSPWPDDMDEAFIPCSTFNYDAGDFEGNFFRLFVTTKRLLSQMEISKNLHVDATYKVGQKQGLFQFLCELCFHFEFF